MARVTIYFDGSCHLCSGEMRFWSRKDTESVLHWVDITDPAFSAEAVGLDPKRVMQVMHVRDANGQLQLGVDGFLAIWSCFPAYRWLVPIVRWKPIYWVAKSCYFIFARLRPYLPKRKSCPVIPIN